MTRYLKIIMPTLILLLAVYVHGQVDTGGMMTGGMMMGGGGIVTSGTPEPQKPDRIGGVKVHSPLEECASKIMNTLQQQTRPLSLISEKALCSVDFNETEWDKITPPQNGNSALDISHEQALLYLKRFAKPGGYDPKKHLNILMAIITSDIVYSNKKEVVFAYQQVTLEGKIPSKSGFKEIESAKRFQAAYAPQIPPFNDEDSCRSPSEMKSTRSKSFHYAATTARRYNNTNSTSSTGSWNEVHVLIPSLRHLPESQQAEIKNPMYRSLGTYASYSYPGLFISKAFMLTKNYVNELFGEIPNSLTDLAVNKNSAGNMVATSIYSSHPIDTDKNQHRSIFGFYTKDNLLTRNDKVQKVTWKTNGVTYKANITPQKNDPSKLPINKADSLSYDKMWKNKELTGLVLVSDNLGATGPKTTSHYIQYYTDQGFTFSEPKTEKDSRAWLGDQIKGGEIDYVMKEAHAGGMDQTLMTISRTNRVLEGEKNLGNGKKEKVYIMVPDLDNSQRIEFTDVKEWMETREKNQDGPLAYVNSSCWSLIQAKNEVPAINSKDFVNIASTSKTTTFFNGENSTKYHILEGIRKGQDYDMMRKGMSKTDRHKKGDNQFKFPDQDEYIEAFSDYTYKINIQNEKGQAYHLDEAGRH